MGDRDEITALVYRYAELLDGGDIDGVVALFADATWRSAATGGSDGWQFADRLFIVDLPGGQ